MGVIETENSEFDIFIQRSFVEIGDQDYIAARLSYKACLIPQFHWQSLQCIEKYLKAILLFSRIKVKNVGHNLDKALSLTKKLPYEFHISKETIDFITHLTKFGKYRYLDTSYYIFGAKLNQLDKAVWELRHYCWQFNYNVNFNGKRTMRGRHVKAIKDNLNNSHPVSYTHLRAQENKAHLLCRLLL